MKPEYEILGKSHFALAVIFDILTLKHPEGCKVTIVPNIPDSENSSVEYPFEHPVIDFQIIDPADYKPRPKSNKILGSIGKARKAIFQYFQSKFGIEAQQYINLIHPSAIVAGSAQLGHGVHISPGSIISPFARLDDFVVINRGVSIGHHSILEEYAACNPESPFPDNVWWEKERPLVQEPPSSTRKLLETEALSVPGRL